MTSVVKNGTAIIQPVTLMTLGNTVSCKEILQISASAQQMADWPMSLPVGCDHICCYSSSASTRLPSFLPAFRCRHLRRVQQFLYSFWIITICFVTCRFLYCVIARDIDGHVVVKLQQCRQSWYSGNVRVYVYVQWTVNFIAFYLWFL
jgi:hypothetical protein